MIRHFSRSSIAKKGIGTSTPGPTMASRQKAPPFAQQVSLSFRDHCAKFTHSSLPDLEHDLHKARRLPLNPFFSKAKVTARQEVIRRNVDKLCTRILGFTEATVDLGAAISAFTRDVSTEFVSGKTYNSLDQEDFNAGMTNVFQDSGHIWRITKHVTWFGPTLKSIPIDWVMRAADQGTKAFFRYLKASRLASLYPPVACADRHIPHFGH